jgi:hypothetical protein
MEYFVGIDLHSNNSYIAIIGAGPHKRLVIFTPGDCGRFTEKNEHPPAMHSAMGWCKHGYINQMLNWPHTGFKALRAGRTPACHA